MDQIWQFIIAGALLFFIFLSAAKIFVGLHKLFTLGGISFVV